MQDRIDCIEKTIAEMQNPMEMQNSRSHEMQNSSGNLAIQYL